MTRCPTCATKLTSAPLRGLIYIRHGTGEQNMYSGRSRCEFSGTGGAPGHILCPTKVTMLTPVLVKKLPKTVKKGYPLFLTFFFQSLRALWTPPHLSCGSSEGLFALRGPSLGGKNRTSSRNFEVGVQSAHKVCVYFREMHT